MGEFMSRSIVSESMRSARSFDDSEPERVMSPSMATDAASELKAAVLRMGADGSVGGDAERTAALALAMLLSPVAKQYRGQIRKCLAWLAACGSDALIVRIALWAGAAKGFVKTTPAPADKRDRIGQQALADRDVAVLAILLEVTAYDETELVCALAEKSLHG
jgi:hypothetical protein